MPFSAKKILSDTQIFCMPSYMCEGDLTLHAGVVCIYAVNCRSSVQTHGQQQKPTSPEHQRGSWPCECCTLWEKNIAINLALMCIYIYI